MKLQRLALLQDVRHQSRNAPRVGFVRLAELSGHPFFFEFQFLPQRAERESYSNQAAPFTTRQCAADNRE